MIHPKHPVLTDESKSERCRIKTMSNWLSKWGPDLLYKSHPIMLSAEAWLMSMALGKCQTTVRMCCYWGISHQCVLKNEKKSTDRHVKEELWKCPGGNAKPSLNIGKPNPDWKSCSSLSEGRHGRVLFELQTHCQSFTKPQITIQTLQTLGWGTYQEDLCDREIIARERCVILLIFTFPPSFPILK